MKVFLISAGAVSIAMGIKLTVPIAVNKVPIIWSIILSWLKPPYLYIIINGIIITVAASSRFHQIQSEPHVQSHRLVSVRTPPPSDFASYSVTTTVVEESQPLAAAAYESDDAVVELKPVMVNGSKTVDFRIEDEAVGECDNTQLVEGVFVNTLPPETILLEGELECLLPAVPGKALVSSRSGRRKPIRSITSERVRAPRVARHDTLENTWKKITEGKSRATHEAPQRCHVPKSKSVKERRSNHRDSPPCAASSGIRREASPSQDELNRRVEEFIKKFNEEMRLQRQESLDKYMEKINSGV
ncbi:hypothetical protein DH2020_008939 [Rehmannia glutinosa]|uniref:DUF4408 domain-containing protein n=1 Tax=Rehmannia glutinosa TaxID=99300 RepID=A0ABR0X645_REHGL